MDTRASLGLVCSRKQLDGLSLTVQSIDHLDKWLKSLDAIKDGNADVSSRGSCHICEIPDCVSLAFVLKSRSWAKTNLATNYQAVEKTTMS